MNSSAVRTGTRASSAPAASDARGMLWGERRYTSAQTAAHPAHATTKRETVGAPFKCSVGVHTLRGRGRGLLRGVGLDHAAASTQRPSLSTEPPTHHHHHVTACARRAADEMGGDLEGWEGGFEPPPKLRTLFQLSSSVCDSLPTRAHTHSSRARLRVGWQPTLAGAVSRQSGPRAAGTC